MSRLDGRVAIVTGAGRGLGRAHATRLAAEGAAVIVNDVGGDVLGVGHDPTPAERVVADIRAAGGTAVASHHDVADWSAAGELIQLAVEELGGLHVLVNNAGIVRDRTIANLTEDEWDAVIRVNLKGHAAPIVHATAHWRAEAKAGRSVDASVINTASAAGLAPSFGQANYSAAKLGVVALAQAVALEGARYGVRANAVSPSARTRIALTAPGADKAMGEPADGTLDLFDPANVSPLIAWLAQAGCTVTGQVFHIFGDRLFVISPARIVHSLRTQGRWTLEALDEALGDATVEPLRVEELITP